MSQQSLATALITGASRSVGKRLTELLLESGYYVYAQHHRSMIPFEHENLEWFQLDLAHGDMAKLPVVDRLDALVHCAGIATLGPTATQPRSEWEAHMDVNLLGPYELTQHYLPALERSSGQMIYVNSGAGLNTHAHWGAYSASKFAARAWCEALRQEHKSIRISSVYPGRIATDMQRAIREQEGGPYTEREYLSVDTVADTLLNILTLPADAHIPDLSIRPR
ncbi:SDR family oxidoreductase [Corynebacterium sp. ES2715-CONJ3]|uniref:SDR family oxidoreductase n=1 Tax=Corynebacterium sp. ES2715-CONJ3 TaxID=2974028 RepID=UPI0021697DED|nr:SDR family oxidoreductase [Corynebacterium sp. ES2715-CONJ3]MCS4492270.1 SDR family oxidoreductase [Corynebacterium sp. ES2715-CONJ3]